MSEALVRRTSAGLGARADRVRDLQHAFLPVELIDPDPRASRQHPTRSSWSRTARARRTLRPGAHGLHAGDGAADVLGLLAATTDLVILPGRRLGAFDRSWIEKTWPACRRRPHAGRGGEGGRAAGAAPQGARGVGLALDQADAAVRSTAVPRPTARTTARSRLREILGEALRSAAPLPSLRKKS